MSDHWKSVKMLFLKKKIMGWHKRDKKIDWITSFIKKIWHPAKSDVSFYEKESYAVS